MPYEFTAKRGTAQRDAGQVQFQCRVNNNCNKACTARTKRGTACRIKACRFYGLCWIHARAQLHVVLRDSRHIQGIKGLVAYDTVKQRAGQPVFKKGERLPFDYRGESLNRDVLGDRYDQKDAAGNVVEVTAPYAVDRNHAQTVVVDGACQRHPAAYINDAHGTTQSNNINIRATPKGRFYPKVFALRDIFHGDELFFAYGTEYWQDHGDAYLQTSTNYVSKH